MEKLSKALTEKKQKTDTKPKHIFYEFQDFAYRLSVDLEDLKHKSLYFRLAKKQKREYLEKARYFAIDYPLKKQKGSSKAKIFMWALKKLKEFGRIPTFSYDELKTENLKLEARLKTKN